LSFLFLTFRQYFVNPDDTVCQKVILEELVVLSAAFFVIQILHFYKVFTPIL